MNKTKFLKALGLVACALLLVVGSVAGTFAYLTSKTETVSNTFTSGNVKITLDEAVADVYGTAPNLEARRDQGEGNQYKLIPGHTYTKDPTVHVVKGSEECYLFVKVENGISDIEGGTKIAAQMATNGWVALDGVANVYYYNVTVDARNADKDIDVPVFATFTIGDDAEVATYAAKTINITAYAVQADGATGADPAAKALSAWTNGNFS